jgi:hypothetical protein
MLPQKPDSTPDRSKDELQRLLQEALKKKRPRWVRLALLATLSILGLLVLIAWLLGPEGQPPSMTVVAFDDLCATGAEITLQGRLEAATDATRTLAGREMAFIEDQGVPAPGQKVRAVSAMSGPQGQASCTWNFVPETDSLNFILRQVGDKFHAGMEDRGRIVFRPPATPLFLVQIDDTLTPSKDQAWRKQNSQDISPAPGASEALQQARERGYEIVYLALAADRPSLYQKMRGWVGYQTADGLGPFPPGVVLSRFTLTRADPDQRPWQKTAELLASRFVLPKTNASQHLGVAGTIDVAQQFHAAGLRTLYLGAGEDVPTGVERLPGWEEVRRALEK